MKTKRHVFYYCAPLHFQLDRLDLSSTFLFVFFWQLRQRVAVMYLYGYKSYRIYSAISRVIFTQVKAKVK